MSSKARNATDRATATASGSSSSRPNAARRRAPGARSARAGQGRAPPTGNPAAPNKEPPAPAQRHRAPPATALSTTAGLPRRRERIARRQGPSPPARSPCTEPDSPAPGLVHGTRRPPSAPFPILRRSRDNLACTVRNEGVAHSSTATNVANRSTFTGPSRRRTASNANSSTSAAVNRIGAPVHRHLTQHPDQHVAVRTEPADGILGRRGRTSQPGHPLDRRSRIGRSRRDGELEAGRAPERPAIAAVDLLPAGSPLPDRDHHQSTAGDRVCYQFLQAGEASRCNDYAPPGVRPGHAASPDTRHRPVGIIRTDPGSAEANRDNRHIWSVTLHRRRHLARQPDRRRRVAGHRQRPGGGQVEHQTATRRPYPDRDRQLADAYP